MRRGILKLLLVCAAAITAVAAAQANTSDWILYNATPSIPRGWYLRTRDDIVIGAMATVRARNVAPGYAASRDFTDAGDRFIKRVAAVAGTRVCAHAETVTIGSETFPRERTDSAGRELPTWEGCHVLGRGEVFLRGDTPDSFDSRYFGIVRENQIEGVWEPL